MSTAPRMLPCPGCGTPVVWDAGAQYRPFCSERCRNADLAAWASERYRVPAVDPPDEPPASDLS